MPHFLSGVRARAEGFAGIAPGGLQQVLITEYALGAAIGWHKDRSVFGACCAEPRAPSGSTVFPALEASAIRSRSGTYLKGMHKHGPDVNLAETAPADACHADR
jgi:hypothetical protein